MRHVRRLISGMIAGTLLAATMGQAAGTALAANTIYVNDMTSNDGTIHCPGTPYTVIQDGVDQAVLVHAKTVVVCQGEYSGGAFVSLVTTGLTVKALGQVVVRPLVPYGGGLFQATDSRKINFQGFIIDGQSNLVGADAFYFFNASGSITRNTVMHWHHATPYAPTGTNIGVYIFNTTKLPVKVDHNTFSDMSNFGMQVTSPGGVMISHNLIQTYTEWLAGAPFHVTYNVTGIQLEDTTGAKVLNNTIMTDQNPVNPGFPISRAIFLIDSSSNQIKSNVVNDYYHGIMLVTSCPGVSSANMITNNKLNETKTGISIGTWSGCSTDVYQNNKVISNKVYTWISGFDTGIRVAAFNNEVVTGNQIKGNTIGGYGTTPLDVTPGNSVSGNKTPLVPPPGA